MIEGIDIQNSSEVVFYNKFDKKISIIPNLKKVNIFIGENNCGKSRLMRSIAKESYEIFSEENCWREQLSYKRNIEGLKELIKRLKECSVETDFNKIINVLGNEDDKDIFYLVENINSQLKEEKNKLDPYNSYQRNIINIIDSIDRNISNIRSLIRDSKTTKNKKIIYIPILRGIENFELYFKMPEGFNSIKMTQKEFSAFQEFKNNAKKIYMNKVYNTYMIPLNRIFTAESIYDEITNKLLSEEENRKFVKEFEEFISSNFYDGIKFSITPNKAKQYLGIKIGKNNDRALYDLGEGIKQLIVLFYKIYENKDEETIFLIEEPEINLHPGFQRKFMEIISKQFSKHQFFITTHSNHIIDLYNETDNISIYKFKNYNKENSKFYMERVSPKDVSILDEIGVKNSSVFMSNCTIWVEGISDRIYLSKYLKLYFDEYNIGNKYKEDIHYSFIEYGGNNIAHWSFVDDNDIETINASSITNNVFLICDNDNNKKQKRKEKLRKVLGDKLYILKSREIENLLSKKVLEETLKNDNKTDELIYKRKSKYDEKNYAKPNVKIAKFIDDTFVLHKKYSGESNVLKNKVRFATIATNNMKSYDDLSEEAKELTEKIVEFIKTSNE